MKTIEYFKLQSKNLYKDFKTQKTYFDSNYGRDHFEYAPKYFDVDAMITDFDIDEGNFTLMNAQHIIATLAGFEKWTEMVSASPSALQLAKLLFDNMHKIGNEEWDYYILAIENENSIILDDEDKLDIFKTVFADVDGHQRDGYDYRIPKSENREDSTEIIKEKEKKPSVQISAIPLVGSQRIKFIRRANKAFENVLQIIEPENPHQVRELWDPENYIDEILLKPEMLPIELDYALSLVDAFLVHHVIGLAHDTSGKPIGTGL